MIDPPMHISDEGLALTKSYEKCRLAAYWDAIAGVWTNGWGHTGTDVHPGDYWTQEYADEVLVKDMQTAIDALNKDVDVPLTQHEFDALADWVYNVGAHSLEKSTLLILLNRGDYRAAAKQLELWDHSRGVVILGLLRRRIAEEDEFTQGLA